MQHQRRRSGISLGFLALGLLAGVALSGGPARAASGPGPYYAEPSWDRKLACPTIANCPRFVVLTNWDSAAVLDKETGLVWERSPDATTLNWPDALNSCIDKLVGSRKGWRLPSISELASLIVPSFPGLTLSPGHTFPTVQSSGYWSATTSVVNSLAWSVDFSTGRVATSASSALHIWCVRGAMNEGTY